MIVVDSLKVVAHGKFPDLFNDFNEDGLEFRNVTLQQM